MAPTVQPPSGVSQPSVRARHMKSVLQALDAYPDAADLRARLPSGLVVAIEEAHGADWLPAELNVQLVAALADALGSAEFMAMSRRLVLASFSGPMLSTLVRTATTLFGDDPASWARWIPHGWSLVFRGCGAWHVTIRDQEAVLHLAGLPPACAASRVWVESVAASMVAVLDLLKRDGSMTLASTTFAGASYLLRWEAARSRTAA